MNWDDCDVTINGVKVPVSDIKYRSLDEYGSDLSMLRRESAPISFETSVSFSGGFDAFAKMLRNDPPGASPQTLARRVKYGGRKGRSALRRLFALALPIDLASEHLRMRGRCVMLSEGEIRIKASSRRT